MDRTMKYAQILTQILPEKSKTRYALRPRVKIV